VTHHTHAQLQQNVPMHFASDRLFYPTPFGSRIAVIVTCLIGFWFYIAPSYAATGDVVDLSRLSLWLGEMITAFKAWMNAAYDKAPALVLVLGALFVMPMTALLAYSAISVRERLPQGPLRSWGGLRTGLTARHARGPAPPVTVAAWPANAWVILADGRRIDLPSKTGLVRLGRHQDNDIQLVETSVHRHHAIIHRTADGEYVVTDLSGATGNGVTVNGARLSQAPLKSGDTFELGAARLQFESAPI
jgi:hypothetical protein